MHNSESVIIFHLWWKWSKVAGFVHLKWLQISVFLHCRSNGVQEISCICDVLEFYVAKCITHHVDQLGSLLVIITNLS